MPATGDEARIVTAYREMVQAMLERRTEQFDALLDNQYTLTHNRSGCIQLA